MSIASKIEWTEATWNPITGCTKVSPGCLNCYAAVFSKRLQAAGNPRYKNGFEVTIHEDLFDLPMHWTKPRMVFVNSMSDLFHEEVSDEVILKLFSIMNQASRHTFQILTKRPERLESISPRISWSSNIWMGVSIEDKSTLFRAELLKKCDAEIKFISAEPLLESISEIDLSNIDWLIVGGESGPHSRPIAQEWVLELKELAEKANSAFYFKQWGGKNKKVNGSLLNGMEYKNYPPK